MQCMGCHLVSKYFENFDYFVYQMGMNIKSIRLSSYFNFIYQIDSMSMHGGNHLSLPLSLPYFWICMLIDGCSESNWFYKPVLNRLDTAPQIKSIWYIWYLVQKYGVAPKKMHMHKQSTLCLAAVRSLWGVRLLTWKVCEVFDTNDLSLIV